jgi:glycosyltransferase involved in cell wall biosynthesis
MMDLFKRWRLESEDWLRYHPAVRRLMSSYQARRAASPDRRDPQALARSIAQLCTAARLAEDAQSEQELQSRIIARVRDLDGSRVDWTEFAPEFNDPRVWKAAILKPFVGPREKGVLFISFETQWIKLLRPTNYRELAAEYTIVVAPSFSPPHVLINYAFPEIFPGPVFTLISNPKDLDIFPRMSSNLVVVPLYASSWVNPELFQPSPRSARAWDLIMVANFAKFKRHHAFFAALRRMPKEFRILLIGQDQDGRTTETIHETAQWYGVEERFTLMSHQPYAEVTRYFCQSRASVVLSKREGSCVAIAESLFADAPAAMLREAELGSRVFINEQTGLFLDGGHLARDLTNFVETADRYQPRAWAEQNISCVRSSHVLNDLLKRHALEQGQSWTQDIAPMQWSPDPVLHHLDDRSRLAPEWLRIRERFGLEIGRPPVQ